MSGVPTLDLAEIKRQAEAATPDEWDWDAGPYDFDGAGSSAYCDIAVDGGELIIAEVNDCFDKKQGRANAPYIVAVQPRRIVALISRLDAAERALELILPLAKGYAAAHQVGSNAAYVAEAEAALAALRAPEPKEPT